LKHPPELNESHIHVMPMLDMAESDLSPDRYKGTRSAAVSQGADGNDVAEI
jgi:hypothetical protein